MIYCFWIGHYEVVRWSPPALPARNVGVARHTLRETPRTIGSHAPLKIRAE
jgi:hypothetical protein